jgi:hypothetical protein
MNKETVTKWNGVTSWLLLTEERGGEERRKKKEKDK